ncbi:hypothetical protein DITRI_Ditri16bG0069500 [Diplodiscus trichospermus]
MADIAMLVAEEYERRVRISTSKVGAQKQDINLVSCVAVLAQKVKNKFGQEIFEALQPKSQISVAAFNGALSA